MRRNQLFWGVILLLIGGLMLANEMGIKLPNGMSLTELFWPMLLIFGGLWVLMGVFIRGNVEVENASIELQGANSANLKISHGAGELRIHSGANANELVQGTFGGGLEHKATRNGDRLEVRMRPAKDVFDFPFFGPRHQLDWDVALNAEVPTSLKLNLGANKSDLDLHDMNITNLDIYLARLLMVVFSSPFFFQRKAAKTQRFKHFTFATLRLCVKNLQYSFWHTCPGGRCQGKRNLCPRSV